VSEHHEDIRHWEVWYWKTTFLNGLFGGRIEVEIGAGSPHIDLYMFEMASGSLTVSIPSQTVLTGGLPSSKPHLYVRGRIIREVHSPQYIESHSFCGRILCERARCVVLAEAICGVCVHRWRSDIDFKFTFRKGVGAVLGAAGCMICYWTLRKENRLVYVQQVL